MENQDEVVTVRQERAASLCTLANMLALMDKVVADIAGRDTPMTIGGVSALDTGYGDLIACSVDELIQENV